MLIICFTVAILPPILDFIDNSINKSLLCSTSKFCPIALTFDDDRVDIKDEIVGIQITLNTSMSPSPRVSLFHAPYGRPYQFGTLFQMDTVSKIAADQGYFHVSWQIDPADYDCGNNITCVTDPIFSAVDERTMRYDTSYSNQIWKIFSRCDG